MAIKAVIFDMDGTLIDSREFIMQAMESSLAAKQVTVTRERLAEVTGKPIEKMYAELAPHLDAGELTKHHHEHHAQNPHLMAEYENVHETLQGLKDKGLKLGIFTGYDERSIRQLQNAGLLDYFDVIVDHSQYKKSKPDPEGLRMCMQKLNVLPDETVYIGDGITDITAGLAANVHKTIGITHGFTSREKLTAIGAQHIVDSLNEFGAYVEKLCAAQTDKMDHKMVEEYLLSMPNTRLDYPFGEGVAVYKADDKMFALISENSLPMKLSLKCDPLLAKTLRERYESVMPGYHLNKKHWNTIILTGQLSWEEVQDLIRHSYLLVTDGTA
jgi:HAD superfamily hydrolase (TIGR01509 family)